ncbi:hypothetical protein [Escherichia phage pO111]|uniref:Uncharacterized protein n=1 Tax=Escherichia phage pO111 TaxID=3072193 RepID=A0AA51N061_9CAUD|nr:hypothetical protein [Escherichia phage pO111]
MSLIDVLKPQLVGAECSFVLIVLSACDHSEILYEVILLISIDMVYL